MDLSIKKGQVNDVTVLVNSTEVVVQKANNIIVEVTPNATQYVAIDRGIQGATGTAATIAVGTTTTLPPSSSASVTNVGSSSAAVFNFGIPQGVRGIQGIQGIQGEQGIQGNTGATGTAATIAVGSTNTLPSGSYAVVSNSGTSSSAVFNFGIPQGIQGIQGIQGVKGDTGNTGATGAGVATGGTTGQALTKSSNTDYDTAWNTVLQTVTSTDGSVSVNQVGSNADLSVAVAGSTTNVIVQVRNNTGATLTKGTVVYMNGAVGQIPTVTKALATSDATSAQSLGMVSADLANNSNGYVTVIGLITNINTSAYTDGAQLYLSSTVAGAVTMTKQFAPAHLVYVAFVEHAHPTQGKLFVKVQNGYEMDELHNVSAQTPSNGNTLVYNTSTNLWEQSNSPIIGGGTIDNTVIGSTTPAAGTFTTITGQTEVLKGTGQNLFLQSNAFTTTWTNAFASTTIGQTDPFGGSLAWTFLADGTSNNHATQQAVTCTSGITYTQSWYLKKGTNNFAQIRFGATIGGGYVNFDLNAGTIGTAGAITGANPTATIINAGNGWYRCAITVQATASGSANNAIYIVSSTSSTGAEVNTLATSILIYGAQLEIGSTLNTYIPTTTTAVYGTPSLSFSGVAGLGLQSDGSLYVQPAGTGALQAQATTSTATGGNARGANAVDWQTTRGVAGSVASASQSVVVGGYGNSSSGANGFVGSGVSNSSSGAQSVVVGGNGNTASNQWSNVVGGYSNTAAGQFNFVGGGSTNSGTANAAVTTQTTTIAVSAGTTIYLSATNANIKVGQSVLGTGINAYQTYATSTVTTGTAAVMNTSTISGTTLTVGSLASGTIIAGMVLTGTGVTAGTYIVSGAGSTWTVSTSQTVASTTITGTAYTFTISQAATTAAGITLSFYTPHGVVVGGGNNQATGSYSFIGGGGDAGTAANRNVASGDWSVVVGGTKNTASGLASFVGAGGTFGTGGVNANIASGTSSFIGAGWANTASALAGSILCGANHTASGSYSAVLFGQSGNTRSINGNGIFASANALGSNNAASQAGFLVLARQTADATATVLVSDQSAAGTTNQVILPNNSAYYFKGSVSAINQFVLTTTGASGTAGTATLTFATQAVAPYIVGQSITVAGVTPTGYNGTYIVTACTTTSVSYANATTAAQTVAGTITGSSYCAAWDFSGQIMRSSSAAGTRLVGTPQLNRVAADANASTWAIALTADTTNGGLAVTVTGQAARTIRWVAKIETTEGTY